MLGNSDMGTLWNAARAYASTVDYSTLLVTLPQDPDLYLPGASMEEALHFMNISVSPTALFVSRTDAGGGTDDDNPNVVFLDKVDTQKSIPLAAPSAPTPSQSSFAACVAGWPATYTCPQGFLWVAPLYTCVPCRPGYFHASKACTPCPLGSYSAREGSTSCTVCDEARQAGMSSCPSATQPSTQQPQATCSLGFEQRGGSCLPCLPGFSKGGARSCSPCAPGQYANAAGRTSCSACPSPYVSTQWGSTGCSLCAFGYVPAMPKADACVLCAAQTQYFVNTKPVPACVNKTVMECGSGYYLQDGGLLADNQCARCLPCPQGQIMVPFLASPCAALQTSKLGAPYRCLPLESVSGQFSRLSVDAHNSSAFAVQYTPCQGLPAHASWVAGPDPSFCFFQCSYAISGPLLQQYLFYYGMQKQDPLTQFVLQALGRSGNIFPLDYPALAVDLMLMANQVCMPCPTSPCGWGLWRPMTQG